MCRTIHRSLSQEPDIIDNGHELMRFERVAEARRRRVLLTGACVALVGTLLLSGCASVGCKRLDVENCEVLEDFSVFGPEDALHFDHHCSDPENAYGASRGAYVFFEADLAGPGRLLVLSEVSLGWVFGPRGGQGFAANLHRVRASELEHWSGDEFSLTLSVQEVEAGERVMGDAMFEYVESRPGLEPQVRAFEVSASGSFDWERFIEPDQEQNEDAARIYKFPKDSRIKIERLPDLEGSYRLLLVAKNRESGEEIMLRGPTLSGLPAHLDLEKPEAGTLGLLGTLNPAQEGGLWHWLGSAAKYGDCVYARRAAKQMFDARFEG